MNATLLIARRDLGAYLQVDDRRTSSSAAVLIIDGMLFNAFALGGGDKLGTRARCWALFFYFSSGTTIAPASSSRCGSLADEHRPER